MTAICLSRLATLQKWVSIWVLKRKKSAKCLGYNQFIPLCQGPLRPKPAAARTVATEVPAAQGATVIQ